MLNGKGTVTAGGMTSSQTIPLSPQLVITESGTAVMATLTADGGVDCMMSFTAAGSGADINAGQSCSLTVNAGFPIQVTLSFVMPGTLSPAANGGLTASLPFNLTAADNLATGSGTLTGPCTAQ